VKNNPFAPGSYAPAVAAAVVLHVLVAVLFWFQWPADERQMPKPVPRHISATVVQEENRAAADRQKQKVEQQKARAAAEKKRQQLADERKRKAAEEARKKKQAAEKAAAKKAEQQKAAAARAEKERLAKEKAEKLALEKAAQEKAAKAEAARKAKEAEELAKQQQADMERQLKEEQAMLERMAAEQAEAELKAREAAEREAAEREQAVISYTAQLRDKIERSWQYPPGVEPDQQVTVRINLVPTGEVIAVTVVKGSGNSALDRSVEQAVMKASPLPVPKISRCLKPISGPSRLTSDRRMQRGNSIVRGCCPDADGFCGKSGAGH